MECWLQQDELVEQESHAIARKPQTHFLLNFLDDVNKARTLKAKAKHDQARGAKAKAIPQWKG